jgi:hypothetical protein
MKKLGAVLRDNYEIGPGAGLFLSKFLQSALVCRIRVADWWVDLQELGLKKSQVHRTSTKSSPWRPIPSADSGGVGARKSWITPGLLGRQFARDRRIPGRLHSVGPLSRGFRPATRFATQNFSGFDITRPKPGRNGRQRQDGDQ